MALERHEEFCSEQCMQLEETITYCAPLNIVVSCMISQSFSISEHTAFLCTVITYGVLCPKQLTIALHASCYIVSLQSQPMVCSSVFTNEHWSFFLPMAVTQALPLKYTVIYGRNAQLPKICLCKEWEHIFSFKHIFEFLSKYTVSYFIEIERQQNSANFLLKTFFRRF